MLINGSLKNITDQKESEAARLEYEKRYRKLFESNIDAVFLMDDNGFIDCNKSALKLFGFTNKSELKHRHPADVSPTKQKDNRSSLESIESYIQQTFKNGSTKFDWIYQSIDGNLFPTKVWLNSLKLDGKTLIQGTVREIKNSID